MLTNEENDEIDRIAGLRGAERQGALVGLVAGKSGPTRNAIANALALRGGDPSAPEPGAAPDLATRAAKRTASESQFVRSLEALSDEEFQRTNPLARMNFAALGGRRGVKQSPIPMIDVGAEIEKLTALRDAADARGDFAAGGILQTRIHAMLREAGQ